MSTVPMNDEQLRTEVRVRYAKTALQVLGSSPTGEATCCGPSCCGEAVATEPKPAPVSQASSSCCESSCCTTDASQDNPITSDLYTRMELGEIPVAAALASLGCGNPTALAELLPGEKVLDLGSGGALMCCFQPNESDQQALPMVWT